MAVAGISQQSPVFRIKTHENTPKRDLPQACLWHLRDIGVRLFAIGIPVGVENLNQKRISAQLLSLIRTNLLHGQEQKCFTLGS
jgi:hypothetical protein